LDKATVSGTASGTVGNDTNPFAGCVLVEPTVRVWSARKLDRTATAAANALHASKHSSGRFNKLLIESEKLKEVQKLGGRIRTYCYDNALPWSGTGIRILPVARFMDFSVAISDLIAQFEQAVQEFLIEYPNEVRASVNRLGDMFDVDDYPSPRALSMKFGAHVSYMPVPDTTSDFRVNLPADKIREMQASLEDKLKDAAEAAKEDLVARLRKSLSTMADKLDDVDATFRNSLFNNITEALQLGEDVGFLGDDSLKEVADKIKPLASMNPDTVRNDSLVRAEASRAAREIANNMAGVFA